MDITTEKLILSNLVKNSDYTVKVLPHIKSEYFQHQETQIIFDIIKTYISTYSIQPDKTTLVVECRQSPKVSEINSDDVESVARELFELDTPADNTWLIKQTEDFCRNKAIYNTIANVIDIYEGKNKQYNYHAIPDLLKEAIGISFETTIGLDFFDDAEMRYQYYTEKENKLEFGIDILNLITNGGVGKKTLNVLVAGVNCGKTLGLISLAADYIRRGQNVLYITLEVREEEILKRVDANMLDVSINDLSSLSKEKFMNKIEKIKSKQHGKLKVKEFPPGTASAAHIKHIMKELKLKQGFEPAILVIDYLGLCASSRIKPGTQNSYFYLKAVAEELRALAVEHDIVCWTAAQFSRGGQANSDADITDVAESHGLSATADFMVGMNRTEELDEAGALQFKQLKNRYGNKTNHLRFLVGVDLEKQKLYEMGTTAQAPKQQQTTNGFNSFTNTETGEINHKKKFDGFEV